MCPYGSQCFRSESYLFLHHMLICLIVLINIKRFLNEINTLLKNATLFVVCFFARLFQWQRQVLQVRYRENTVSSRSPSWARVIRGSFSNGKGPPLSGASPIGVICKPPLYTLKLRVKFQARPSKRSFQQ